MSIEIPNLQPVVTPVDAALDESLRVGKAAHVERIPADLGHPRVDRRQSLERRARTESRSGALDLRSGHERRAGEGIDVEV